MLYYEPKDQLPLAPGISGTDKAVHQLVRHEAGEDSQLLRLIGRYGVLPVFWNDRQVFGIPASVFRFVDIGGGKFDKVPKTPEHDIAIP